MSSVEVGGTTTECLVDFFGKHPDLDTRYTLAEFAGVQESTVRRWQVGGNMPKGSPLLKVRVFLDLIGYKVKEFSELPELARQFAQLIAFGLISEEAARELLDYKNLQDVYRVLLKGEGLMPQRVHRLRRFVESSTDELNQYSADWLEKLVKLRVDLSSAPCDDSRTEEPDDDGTTEVPVAALVLHETPAPATGANTTLLVYSLANLLKAGETMMEYLDDSGDESWRQTLLVLTGNDVARSLESRLGQMLE